MNFRDFIPSKDKLIKIIVFVFIIGGILSVIKVTRDQQKAYCFTRLDDLYGDVRTKITPINNTDITFKYRLRDYYIKSSYNSCSCGDFSNGYVSLEALKQIIRQGVRLIDLEIYSVGGKAVVAASKDDNFHIKGTLNSLPISDVLKTIHKNACNRVAGSEICPNPTDPLFINLRIKSNQNDIYNEIADTLNRHFDNLLSKYDKKYAFESGGKNLGNEGLSVLREKVIIICDRSNSNYRESKLEELVNMNSISIFLKKLRNYDVVYAPSSKDLVEYNKKNMSVTMPDYNPLAVNDMNSAKHHQAGCQFVCMNFQAQDANIAYYNKLFEEKRSAFILKNKNLRYIKTSIPRPTPPDPQLSYEDRDVVMRQYQGKM